MRRTTVKLQNVNELQVITSFTSFIPSGDMNLQQSN
jgi:hypothetical protein